MPPAPPPESGAVTRGYRVQPPGTDNPLGTSCSIVEDCYERLYKIWQGTFGDVFLARDVRNGDLVALKKIKVEREADGFPLTAIREIRILPLVRHTNVVRLREMTRSRPRKSNGYRGSVYMVFDYCESDLAGMTADGAPRVLSPGHVKSIMLQLLRGVAHCHGLSPPILHRDLKLSNLLVTQRGGLKIADFGLARAHDTYQVRFTCRSSCNRFLFVILAHVRDEPCHLNPTYQPPFPPSPYPEGRMTNRVITLWYRPPEILLGSEQYGPEVDVWSAGCIFAELVTGRPLFQGSEEGDQLGKITRLLGSPTATTWPWVEQLPHAHFLRPGSSASRLRAHLQQTVAAAGGTPLEHEALGLLEQMLSLNPATRITASAAVEHAYFTSGIAPDHQLPCTPGSHEMLTSARRRQGRAEANQREQAVAERAAKRPRV